MTSANLTGTKSVAPERREDWEQTYSHHRALGLLCVLLLSACSNSVQWDEEVKLSDGRKIVVTQKKRCEGGDYRAETNASCIAREAWLTIGLPGFSSGKVTWHGTLRPMVINTHEGRLYMVGFPPTTVEFRAHGASNPPYVGFVWKDGGWEQIPFATIPEAIYDSNMLVENIPKNKTSYLSLERKNSRAENGDPRYPAYFRRIDPSFSMSPY